MQQYNRRPDRHASGRENSTDPEPGSVRITIEATSGDLFIDIPAGVDPIKLAQILTEIYQGLRSRTTENHTTTFSLTNIDDSAKEYDVFISHASEDKDPLVEELVKILRTLGIRVWYDKNNIGWGDSFREKMDEGLSKARYGIVILSPDYIKGEKYWTKAELDVLFQKESATGQKVLLPVWHHLSKNEVMDFSPFIASRNALSTATLTISEIAYEVKRIVNRHN